MSEFKGKSAQAWAGKLTIIDSLRPLLSDLRYVAIDDQKILAFCSRLHARDFRAPEWTEEFIYPALDETGVNYFMLFNSLNFCYWGRPKWSVDRGGKTLDGAWGMLAALSRAISEGTPILEGKYLATVSRAEFARLLRGNGTIPLFEERLAICREVGRVLCRRFGGGFHRVVEEARGSALKLVKMLVSRFPSYDDSVIFNHRRLLFYKRAQLAPAMIAERWRGKGIGYFDDLDRLTVSADYKLPQVLRRLGILEYRNGLDAKVDENRVIKAGAREEIEIRAATILAAEMMVGELGSRLQDINSQRVDRLLWLIGQRKSPDDKPYHKTLTTAY